MLGHESGAPGMGSVSSSEGEEAQDQAARTKQERDPGAEPASAWSWARVIVPHFRLIKIR